MSTVEQVAETTEEDACRQRPVATDTAFRCAIAVAIVRLGMRITEFGARRVSHVHPARFAYNSAVMTWRDKARSMPWWGFVPTNRLISLTQSAWLMFVVVVADAALYAVGLPYVHMHGLLRHHVPQVSISVHSPRG
jgi:hypothetical protein